VKITLKSKADLPLGPDNLIARAYEVMRERFDLADGLAVELEKNIPIAAGLGGGSSDGAATILACRALFGLDVGRKEMATISLDIGSDLPFFFSRGQAHVTGRGERVTEVELPTDYWLVLVTPDVRVSTGEAYARLRLALTKSRRPFSLRRWRTPKGLIGSLIDTVNDFEEVHLESCPELGRIKEELLGLGARLARMSGSGPTVFGIYFEAPEFDGGSVFGRDDWQVSVVRPIVLPGNVDSWGVQRGDH
jgi:4-diphosphocytidyl-2-C-methyl-D-erythritol kinase